MNKIKKAEITIYPYEVDVVPTVVNSNLAIKQILDQKLSDLEKTKTNKIKILKASMEKDLKSNVIIINVEYEVKKK